jgi:hypothetical protein
MTRQDAHELLAGIAVAPAIATRAVDAAQSRSYDRTTTKWLSP